MNIARFLTSKLAKVPLLCMFVVLVLPCRSDASSGTVTPSQTAVSFFPYSGVTQGANVFTSGISSAFNVIRNAGADILYPLFFKPDAIELPPAPPAPSPYIVIQGKIAPTAVSIPKQAPSVTRTTQVVQKTVYVQSGVNAAPIANSEIVLKSYLENRLAEFRTTLPVSSASTFYSPSYSYSHDTASVGSLADAVSGLRSELGSRIETLEFLQASSTASDWTTVLAGLAYTGGNVGIGTTTPGSKLTVQGDASVAGNGSFGGTVTASMFYGDGSNLTGITGGGSVSTSSVRAMLSALSPLAYNSSTGVFSVSTSSLGLTTSNVSEGSNLYYTDGRADARADIRFAADLAAATTDNLAQGSANKYFSNTLARAAVSAGSNIGYDSAAGIFSIASSTIRGMLSSSAAGISYDNSTGIFSLASGYVIPLSASTTEWANAASAIAPLSASSTLFSAFYITPSTRITAGSGLAWNGNTLLVSTSTLSVGTSTYAVNAGTASTSTYAATAGTAATATNSVTALNATNAASSANSALLNGQNGSYYLDRSNHTGTENWSVITGTPTTLSGYGITDAQALDGDLTAVSGLSGTGLAFRTGANTWTTVATTSLGLLTTNVAEGSNLYFTNTRADQRFAANLAATTTDALAQGSVNKYFSNTLARAAFSAGANISYDGTNGIFSIASSTIRGMFSSADATLLYSSSTGIFSVASGYTIPLTASTTEWASRVASQWATNGSDISFSGGKVGIGTTTPNSIFSIVGQSAYGGEFSVDDSLGNPSIIMRDFQNAHEFSIKQTYSDGRVAFTANTLELMTMWNGNVGISNSNPQATLDVNGDIFVSGALRMGGNTGGNGYAGDVIARRDATTGAYFFGDGDRYLYYDNHNYQFGSGSLYVNTDSGLCGNRNR